LDHLLVLLLLLLLVLLLLLLLQEPSKRTPYRMRMLRHLLLKH
jgi:hypothetical protein